MTKKQKLKNGIYFHNEFGFYLYDIDDNVFVFLEEEPGMTPYSGQDLFFTKSIKYVCKNIKELFLIIKKQNEYNKEPPYSLTSYIQAYYK
jgi:hypothetical protein